MKRNTNFEKLHTLIGKKVQKVSVSTAHGDVLEIVFADGTSLGVCTTHGLTDESVEDDPNDLYITLNDITV